VEGGGTIENPAVENSDLKPEWTFVELGGSTGYYYHFATPTRGGLKVERGT
jgi:hypothetical protein